MFPSFLKKTAEKTRNRRNTGVHLVLAREKQDRKLRPRTFPEYNKASLASQFGSGEKNFLSLRESISLEAVAKRHCLTACLSIQRRGSKTGFPPKSRLQTT
jgi:hypothetical protein